MEIFILITLSVGLLLSLPFAIITFDDLHEEVKILLKGGDTNE